jgi:outer membrane protein OmpA-like peptidoglycan-associated protein
VVLALALAAVPGCAPRPPAPLVLLVPVAAAQPVPPRRLLLSIPFRLDSHAIDPSARPLLDNLAAAMREEAGRGVIFDVNGHTDLSGRFAWNVALSYLRASAVADALVARGVPPSALRVQGFGPLWPLTPEEPFAATNRRVEVVALGP